VALLATTFLLTVPLTARARPGARSAPALIDNAGRMDANNLDLFVTNHGSFGLDLSTFGPGLHYPKGTSKTALFAAGIWVGAQVNDSIRTCTAEYVQEYEPGPMYNGTFQADQAAFKNYRLEAGNTTSSDYLNWPYLPPPGGQGAPLDTLGNPLLEGDLTLWSAYNDADPAGHIDNSGGGGGPGGTAPLGLEIQQTTFAFARGGALGNTIFLRFRLINKGENRLDSTYISIWADPDLGDAVDDLVGCDTTLSLGYCYNETNNDAVYGSAPPAIGFDFFRGPIVQSSPGVHDTLGLTSFNKYINGEDPTTPTEAYLLMKGRKRDGSPLHVNDDPFQPVTTFQFPGDPVTGTGWLDTGGNDRRMQLSTGPFTFAVGDTQEVVCALIIGQGADRLSSISDLKQKDAVAQLFFDLNLNSTPPTAIAATLLESVAEPGRVALVWRVHVPEVASATVFRREERGDWTRLGAATPDGGSRLKFEDATVRAGSRYAYRLVVRDLLGEETSLDVWVDVPLEGVPSAAALRLGTANPSGGRVGIRYGLPAAGPARLEVYDVRGGRVATLTNSPSTAGWHGMTWNGKDDRGQAVASGIYLLRLTTRNGAVVRKVAVAR